MRKLVAGIDIGGTTTSYVLADSEGNVLADGTMPTCGFGSFDEYASVLALRIKELSESLGSVHSLVAAGAGAPSADFAAGEIVSAPNLPWKGRLPLSGLLSEYLGGIPVCADNDANAAALGEMMFGGACGMKNFLVITLGTGVGCGIVAGGEIVHGERGMAGEFGHMAYERHGGRQCGCGRKGCLEAYVSAKGMVRTLSALIAETHEDSEFRNLPFNAIDASDIASAASRGDRLALETFRITGRILGEAVADAVAFADPQAVFFFGGPTASGDLLMSPLREAFRSSAGPLWKDNVILELSSVDAGRAAVLGAAAMAWKKHSMRPHIGEN